MFRGLLRMFPYLVLVVLWHVIVNEAVLHLESWESYGKYPNIFESHLHSVTKPYISVVQLMQVQGNQVHDYDLLQYNSSGYLLNDSVRDLPNWSCPLLGYYHPWERNQSVGIKEINITQELRK